MKTVASIEEWLNLSPMYRWKAPPPPGEDDDNDYDDKVPDLVEASKSEAN